MSTTGAAVGADSRPADGEGEAPTLLRNGRAFGAVMLPEHRRCLDPAAAAAARAALKQWPVYAPTPLVPLPGLAQRLRLGAILAKDESRRAPLESFKALGGAYALSRLLLDDLAARGVRASLSDLFGGRVAAHTNGFTVSCATDGNHGRSVAWGARMFGCNAVIYLPGGVSPGRAEAIERLGATLVRVDGNYDEAVAQAEADASRLGRAIVSDKAYEGYADIPRTIMEGYTILFEEAFEQLAEPPTHLLVQTGCGGLAGAAIGETWHRFGAERPITILVEPARAACAFRSLEAGRQRTIGGDHATLMGGLACGEVSDVAWPLLRDGAHFALAMSDENVAPAMRLLAGGVDGDPPLVAGESGVAGIAALMHLVEAPAMAQEVGLTRESRVLVIVTEGATDQDCYRRLVGHDPVENEGTIEP